MKQNTQSDALRAPADVPELFKDLYTARYEHITHKTNHLFLFAADQKLEHLNELRTDIRYESENNFSKGALENFKHLPFNRQESVLHDLDLERQSLSDRVAKLMNDPDIANRKSPAEINEIWKQVDDFGRNIAKLRGARIGSEMEIFNGVQKGELNSFLHGLVHENLNELKVNIPDYATSLGVKPENIEHDFIDLGKTEDIVGNLAKLVNEHPEEAHLLSKVLEVEPQLKPETQIFKDALDEMLSQKE